MKELFICLTILASVTSFASKGDTSNKLLNGHRNCIEAKVVKHFYIQEENYEMGSSDVVGVVVEYMAIINKVTDRDGKVERTDRLSLMAMGDNVDLEKASEQGKVCLKGIVSKELFLVKDILTQY